MSRHTGYLNARFVCVVLAPIVARGQLPDDLIISPATLPPFEANRTITTSGAVTIAGGCVAYTAPNQIDLKAGFWGKAGATFHGVLATPLTAGPAQLPGGAFGAAYQQSLVAAGGRTPYSWTLLSALPSGLSLVAGQITEMPSAAGAFNFSVQATDSVCQAVTATVGLAISKASQNISFMQPVNVVFGSTATVTV